MDDAYDTVSTGEQASLAARSTQTLSELVNQHPLVAVAASAAVGAGIAALVIAATRSRSAASGVHVIGTHPSSWYDSLQSQLRHLADRFDDKTPSKDEINKALGGLGAEATRAWNSVVDTAQRGAATGVNLTHKVAEHPVLASLAVSALGALLASLKGSSSSQGSTSAGADGSRRVPDSAAKTAAEEHSAPLQ